MPSIVSNSGLGARQNQQDLESEEDIIDAVERAGVEAARAAKENRVDTSTPEARAASKHILHNLTVTSRTGNAYKRQTERIVVRVVPRVYEAIEPLFRGRKGAVAVDEVARHLTLNDTMRLISEEPPPVSGVRNHQLFITPSPELRRRAYKLYLSPQIMCRAAAVKMAQEADPTLVPPGRHRRRTVEVDEVDEIDEIDEIDDSIIEPQLEVVEEA